MATAVFSVGQVNSYIKNLFKKDYVLKKISIRGEISNCKYHPSGHIYFTLKDETGLLNAIMFKSRRNNLNIRLTDGLTVIASGSIDVYERDGRYQFYVESLKADGAGALYLQYEKYKEELEEMGMFAKEYKKPVPRFGTKIGVVTASTGAAIKDIFNITSRRNPCVTLYLYPALVQGDMAARSISKGIEILDGMGLDCIIVGRGGGSLEDLWAFNEKETAYAIFNADTPVISAVGHETDFTIADFVADLRAPTPSAAAELAVFDYSSFMSTISVRNNQLKAAFMNKLEKRQSELSFYAARLELLKPESKIKEEKNKLLYLENRLLEVMERKIKDYKNRIYLDAGKLEALSPLKKLTGGFAYVKNEHNKAVKYADSVSVGDNVTLQFSDGVVYAMVESKKITE